MSKDIILKNPTGGDIIFPSSEKIITTTITLSPVSSDPTPVTGLIQYADGTARLEGVWVYKNSNWEILIPRQSLTAPYIDPDTKQGLQNADKVVGSAGQVTAEIANYTSIQDAVNSLSGYGGGKIYIMSGTYTENVILTTDVYLEGAGHKTMITGNVTFNSNYCLMKNLKVNGNILFNGGTDGNRIGDCWLASGNTVTNNGGGGNYWEISQE